MARIKYYYDTESCRYERIRVSTWDVIYNGLGFLALALLLAGSITFVYIRYFESPEEAMLRKENDELRFYYELMSKHVNDTDEMLALLQERDDGIYRVIMGAEPVPDEIRKAGFGGGNKYENLMDKGLEQEDLIRSNFQKIDQLKKKMYIQTKSYDDIMELAKNNELQLACTPAIPPVAREDYKRLSSGFGRRVDPITKVRGKMHYGVDFALPKGSPIYATGDGTVSLVKFSWTGFGRQIVIDHGFGYKTRYAHLNEHLVKKGQKVKRGELIGYSGNSGKSTAPHLHYEVHKNNQPINPKNYFYLDIDPEEYEEILRLAAKENQMFDSY